MPKININKIEGYDEFKKEVLAFFESEKEYPKWTGKEKFIIISDIPEEELLSKYSNVMNAMRPYMILDSRFDNFYSDAESTERSIERFINVHQTTYDFDENTEYCNDEIIDYDSERKMVISLELQEAMGILTKVQRRRVISCFFEGKSFVKISESEGISERAIRDSIETAIKKMKKFLG